MENRIVKFIGQQRNQLRFKLGQPFHPFPSYQLKKSIPAREVACGDFNFDPQVSKKGGAFRLPVSPSYVCVLVYNPMKHTGISQLCICVGL